MNSYQNESNSQGDIMQIFRGRTADKIFGWLLFSANTLILLTLASIPFSEGVREFLSIVLYNVTNTEFWFLKGIVISFMLVLLAGGFSILRTGSTDMPLEFLPACLLWPILFFMFFGVYIVFFPIIYLRSFELITGKGPLY